jgi:tRNA(Arg) A34 adenosine deaminase TadA
VISAAQTLDNPLLNHRVQWREGLEETEAAALLRAFFKARR